MAANKKDLKSAIAKWHDERIRQAEDALRKEAEEVKSRIAEGLTGSSVRAYDSPADTKHTKNPYLGLPTYSKSLILEEDGEGLDKTVSVKIDDPSKKDGTTGMELAKIAKAIEFGTTKKPPRPAWRRSLAELRAKGTFRKKAP